MPDVVITLNRTDIALAIDDALSAIALTSGKPGGWASVSLTRNGCDFRGCRCATPSKRLRSWRTEND